MEVIKKISEAIDILNEVDEYTETLTDKLSVLDSKEQDLLHYIENNKISILWCYRMIKEIKAIREERRKVKNDMELTYEFGKLKNRLTAKDSRMFMLAEIHKKEKQLQSTYKNRQYSEEDMERILKGK